MEGNPLLVDHQISWVPSTIIGEYITGFTTRSTRSPGRHRCLSSVTADFKLWSTALGKNWSQGAKKEATNWSGENHQRKTYMIMISTDGFLKNGF